MDQLYPHSKVAEYSSFAADHDMQTDIGGPARELIVVDAGSGTKQLSLVLANGVAVALTVYNGWRAWMYVKTIVKTATTVVTVQAFR